MHNTDLQTRVNISTGICRGAGAASALQGAEGAKPHRLVQYQHNCNPPKPDALSQFELASKPGRRAIASRLNEAGPDNRWHQSRARGLGRPFAEKLHNCGKLQCVAVKANGEVVEWKAGCGQKMCARCAKKKANKLRHRLRASIEAHSAKNKNRRIHLLTLTVRDSDDIKRDRDRITTGWRRWRAWWHKRYGYAFTYAFVWEVTPGQRGQGHVHAHVVAWLPKWWSWSKGQEAWNRAVGGEGGNVDISNQCKAPNANAKAAANYVAKYVSKGINLQSMPAELAAQWWCASYMRRGVNVSRGFWAVHGVERVEYISVEIELPKWPTKAHHLDKWWATGPP